MGLLTHLIQENHKAEIAKSDGLWSLSMGLASLQP